MKIVCPACKAVYRFDPARIPDGGKRVQCSQCNHVFMVMPPSDVEPEGMYSDEEEDRALITVHGVSPFADQSLAQDVAAASQSESGRLILRQDGTRYSVEDLATLRRWIVERRITKEAELSSDGENWEGLAEREDLASSFEQVASQQRAQVAVAPKGVRIRNEGIRVATTRQSSDDYDDDDYELEGEEEEEGFLIEDDDFEDEDDIVNIDLSVSATSAPVLRKSDLLPEQPQSTSKKAVVAPSTPASTPVLSKAAVAPPPEEEEESKGGAGIFLALVALLLIGVGVWWVIGSDDPVDGPLAHNNGAAGGNPVVLPVKTPAPTAKPTAIPKTATPAPTPVPAIEPVATPKPVVKAKPKPRPKVRRVVSKPKQAASPKVKAGQLFAEGRKYLDRGDYQNASAKFDDAIELYPLAEYFEELGWAHLGLHDTRRRTSDLAEAERAFKNAVARDGSRSESFHGLGIVYRRKGDLDKAIKAFEDCLKRNPGEDIAAEARYFLDELQRKKAAGL